MNLHPVLLAYKKTEQFPFDLILAVGREPNSTETIGDALGHYDWRRHRCRTGFWATANEVLAEVVGVSAREYKSACETSNSSPITIANAMPFCAREGSGQQRRLRHSATHEEVEQHMNNLLKQSQLLARVQCVWLCGLSDPVFDASKELLKNSFLGSKPTIFLPHLRNTNRPKIRQALQTCSEDTRQLLKDVFAGFESHFRKAVD
jgi:hypothetical protein